MNIELAPAWSKELQPEDCLHTLIAVLTGRTELIFSEAGIKVRRV